MESPVKFRRPALPANPELLCAVIRVVHGPSLKDTSEVHVCTLVTGDRGADERKLRGLLAEVLTELVVKDSWRKK